MERALAAHKQAKPDGGDDPRRSSDTARKPRTVEEYLNGRRLPAQACVHCHQVYDFRREFLQGARKWTLDEVWVYPQPENVGLTLERDRSHRVSTVVARSAAARAGLRPGDELVSVNGVSVISFADVQYGLHRAPATGRIAVVWQREGRKHEGELELLEGWRKTDVSWRWSLRGLDPTPWVRGDDLMAEEKRKLGLDARRLAFRQGPFVPTPIAEAGIRQNDVILGIDGQELQMTARQFQAHVRLTCKVGQRITFNLLRDGTRLDVPFTLLARPRSP
jgi:S1-C subfamily serine protease